MCSDIAISVKNLSKTYRIFEHPTDRIKQMLTLGKVRFHREFTALQDVSFEIKKGEAVGIIGRNGSGKSTLLQLICGILKPTSGEVRINGRISALLELGSGFNPEFTGRENIYFQGAVMGIPREEMEGRFDDVVSFADIGEFIDQPVRTYSSGMYVRLAFAVNILSDPEIIIVDEALAVGDEKFQRKCFARLEQLKSRGLSILFVSHSTEHIAELCEKVLLLDHGERLKYGAPLETIRAYQKLIYAPFEKQDHLAQEFRAADRTDDIINIDIENESANVSNERPSLNFDPGLVPETTTAYPVQGAEIETIRILNAQGDVVNVLQPGCNYQFVVSGRFLTNVEGVYFGIHIRSISGVVITGQRYPEEGKYVEHIEAGKAFKINFGFRMDLLPGVYFVGGGIWSSHEPNCPHRILDALMFRVTQEKSPKSFGYVDISANESIIELF
ncbi:MAG: ABC transporter ATP-binding protein [Gallionellales bacterium GWA2_60_142]|nr:MAG: ABC transporter ATP-binding protein [Gallionellales bacterium GWA2_60_142]HCI12770.1 ABC transporter ATP-binding protein [Gallionellaceae bacterium]